MKYRKGVFFKSDVARLDSSNQNVAGGAKKGWPRPVHTTDWRSRTGLSYCYRKGDRLAKFHYASSARTDYDDVLRAGRENASRVRKSHA